MKFAVLIKDTVSLSQFLPSSLKSCPYSLCPPVVVPSFLNPLCCGSCAASPSICSANNLPVVTERESDAPPSRLPPASGAFAHFLLPWSPLSRVAHPYPHSPPWTTSVSLRTQAIRRLRDCVASTAGEPISSASGLGSFLDLEPLCPSASCTRLPELSTDSNS